MIRTALVSLLALAALPASAQVSVSGEWIKLGDVAPVTGDAAGVLVAQAPRAGESLTLDPEFLIGVAKRSGILLALPINQPIIVTRTVAPAKAAPTPPAARQAPYARQAPSPPTVASQPAPDGWVLVFARDVPRGVTLAESDLSWADAQTARAGRTPPEDIADAIGLETKRALKAGVAVQLSDLKAPSVIHKNEPIKIIYTAPGMRLTVDGVAQADAAAGENIRVLNSLSKRTIEAVATAEGEARVYKR
jgi:flagella basal body P-ring formation protein FlgA